MKRKSIKIAPSLLSADFANLASEVCQCRDGGADLIHLDVMDGHFVPNITIGPIAAKAIKPLTDLPLDCHLMISEPDKFIPAFAEAGAGMISAHVEAAPHINRVLSLIRSYGVKAGAALNPATPLEFAFEAAEDCDFILLMSVNPGFGGQKFILSFLRRAERLSEFLIKNGLENVDIEVDGGVKIDNAEEIVRAGASILVSGSGLFKGDFHKNITALRENALKGAEV